MPDPRSEPGERGLISASSEPRLGCLASPSVSELTENARGPLQRFAAEHLGPVQVTHRPEVLGHTRLVQVRDTQGRHWFVKRLLSERQWQAESSAYQLWDGVRGVARVHARCHDRQLLLLPQVPGARADGGSPRVLREAGAMLRRLHDVAPPDTWFSDWRSVMAGALDRRLDHLRTAGIEVDERLVHRQVEELLAYAGPDVATHGDFLPRNWLWQRRGRLHVIDFGAAGPRPVPYDLSRLRFRICWDRPERFEAVMKGYGRPLSEAEERFLTAMMPWRAVVAMSMGVHHRWPGVVRHGQRVLQAVGSGKT